MGGAIGLSGTNWSLDHKLGGGTLRTFQLGLYGRQDFGSAYVTAALAYGNFSVATDRSAGSDSLTANYGGWGLSGRAEAGYRLAANRIGLTPYAAVTVQNYFSPSYREVGGGYALNFASQSTADTTTELGLRLDAPIGDATLRMRAAWLRDHFTAATMNGSFADLAGSAFTVTGASRASDAALLLAGIDWRLASKLNLTTSLNGVLSSSQTSYGGMAKLRLSF